MTANARWSVIAVGMLAIAGIAFVLTIGPKIGDGEKDGDVGRPGNSTQDAEVTSGRPTGGDVEEGSQGVVSPESEPAGSDAEEEPLSEDERREREEEKLVETFDTLTDKWMEPAKDGVSMKDVDEFSAQFRKVPRARREECLQRALNLVPDENVMLLAGILMDKSQDKELVELVYNDVLNRAEDVKKPILQEIFKDKTHPCWADTAWILDVTGELSREE